MLTDTANEPVNQIIDNETSVKKARKKVVKETDAKKIARVSLDEEAAKALDDLRGSLSRSEYLQNLLIEQKSSQTEKESNLSDSLKLGTEPQVWFTSTSKNTSVDEIKLALGLEGSEIIMSETELLAKASKLSGYSVAEIQRLGRQTFGQKLVSQFCKPREGSGQAGVADCRLDHAYKALQEKAESSVNPKKITLTSVASAALANYNSAKSWAKRRGYQAEFGLD